MSEKTVTKGPNDMRARIAFDRSESEWTVYFFGDRGRYAWLVPGQKTAVILVRAPGDDGVRGETMSTDLSSALKMAIDWLRPEEQP